MTDEAISIPGWVVAIAGTLIAAGIIALTTTAVTLCVTVGRIDERTKAIDARVTRMESRSDREGA